MCAGPSWPIASRPRYGARVCARSPRPGRGSTLELPELEAVARALDPAVELAAQARRLLAAPAQHGAPVLDAAEELDARACAAVLGAVVRAARARDPHAGPELIAWLERLPVAAGRPVTPDAVLITDPLSIRARRFPPCSWPGCRRGSSRAARCPIRSSPMSCAESWRRPAGLRLRLGEDPLHRERYLLYACVSRATERLVLSYRSSDEEGNLALPSPFLRDVADLLDRLVEHPSPAPAGRRGVARRPRRRPSSSAGGRRRRPPRRRPSGPGTSGAPVVAAASRTCAIARSSPPARSKLRPMPGQVADRAAARPRAPGARPRAAGARLVHARHARACAAGARRAGDTRALPRAGELLDELLGDLPGDIAPGSPPGVRAAALAMIGADLHRYLEHEARSGADWRPAALEQRFGFDDDEDSLPALELVDGDERVRVRGAIDRIDVDRSGRQAMVRDYKSGSVRAEFQGTKWADERRLQVGLYMLAVRELTGLEPVAGLYQPLARRRAAPSRRLPRGRRADDQSVQQRCPVPRGTRRAAARRSRPGDRAGCAAAHGRAGAVPVDVLA